jgi:hypothetical protein
MDCHASIVRRCHDVTVRILTALVAGPIVVVASLAGCSSDQPAIKAGTCLARETTASGEPAPDLTSIVACTSEHRYEVYDVIQLRENRRLEELAQRRCATSLLRVTGYDNVKVNGKTAAAAGVTPALRGIEAPQFAAMPEQALVSGRRQVVCTARTTVPVRSGGTGGQLVAAAKTSAFPVALRRCRAYDEDRRNVREVSCSRRHVSELLFFFDAGKAFGRRFVADIVRAPTAEKFDQLDRACTRAASLFLGKGFDPKRLRGFGSVARRWTSEGTPVRCDVGPIEFRTTDLPPGSLVGSQDNPVKLVPFKREGPSVV